MCQARIEQAAMTLTKNNGDQRLGPRTKDLSPKSSGARASPPARLPLPLPKINL
jgi:hypothetical protein